MNYQTAFYIAIGKRVLGWIVFSLVLVSTVVSLISLAVSRKASFTRHWFKCGSQ